MSNHNPTSAPIEAPAPIEATPNSVPYQAPAIESVFSPDDLHREVLYAGTPISDSGVPSFPGVPS